jgi:hypothetical protein
LTLELYDLIVAQELHGFEALVRRARRHEGVCAPGGIELARFQGDVSKGSDRAAATVLFLILLAVLLLAIWSQMNPAEFNAFWNNLSGNAPNR